MNIDSIDRYLRTEVQQLRYEANAIEPTPEFARRTIQRAREIERRRRLRLNIGFAVLALAPFGMRETWEFIRHDFVSVASLPFARIITYIYHMIMSPFAPVVLIAGGFVVAMYIVGLPHWRKPILAPIFKKMA